MFMNLTRNQIIIIVIIIAAILYYIYSRKMRTSETTKQDASEKQSNAAVSGQKPFTFYNFYNPGCGWCKKLAPTWAQLSAKYKDHAKLNVVAIDASKPENEQIAFYYNVTSYPTLIMVTPNRNVQYTGDRSMADLEDFIKQMMQ